MILGASTGTPSRSIQDGSGFRAPSSRGQGLRSALELASSLALAGAGITGEPIGTTTTWYTTMTGTSPTAGLSSIATTTVTDIHCSLIPEEFLMAENFRMAVDFRARAGSLTPPVLFPAAELFMAADFPTTADFLILPVFFRVAELL